MSLVGKEIEPFSAQAYQDREFITVTDADLKGHWSIVMFYPADFSFVCPTELADLQDQYQTLQKLGVEVYSVSEDTHFVHMAWHEDSEAVGKIQFAMIGDPSHKLARMFDVLDEEQGLAQRGTFILDDKGVVQSLEINADGIGRNASEYIDRIKAGQFVESHPGQVCPAKWQEGAATLTPGVDLVGKI